MARYTESDRRRIYGILVGGAMGSVKRCSELTGASCDTVQRIRREFSGKGDENPTPDELCGMILRRVAAVVPECKDPKKLMETYVLVREALCGGGEGQDGLEKIIAQFGGRPESEEG